MSNELNGRRVAILVTDGFEQIELTSPREALEKAGATCVLISNVDGKVQGFKHHDKADRLKVELSLKEANAAEFDAVLLPGGVINGDALRIDKDAQRFVQQIDRAGKPVMVICHGGWILISAGLVNGRTITTWPTLQDDMRNAGATWKDEECIRDRNWVSSRKPDDLPAFNRECIRALFEGRASQRTGVSEEREARL
ncbi:MAG TPA: type 1 glutamine amidotransferase domain-containing protein [Thermoanaerobaculia bacterium]|nr:type 1 glutamine amidotransferase domain-containing protein [Thermoanaerobaculia bacterium]